MKINFLQGKGVKLLKESQNWELNFWLILDFYSLIAWSQVLAYNYKKWAKEGWGAVGERDEEGMHRFQSRLQLRGMRITNFLHISISLKGFSRESEFSELNLLQKVQFIQLHQC